MPTKILGGHAALLWMKERISSGSAATIPLSMVGSIRHAEQREEPASSAKPVRRAKALSIRALLHHKSDRELSPSRYSAMTSGALALPIALAIFPRSHYQPPLREMRFIDLFAGLGGFHLALTELGHECVFACEKDEKLRGVYKTNFGLLPHGDIRTVHPRDIPAHEILCAGFPCQPFSKAGEQEGFDCPNNGDLFGYVMRIVRHHRPTYLLLENVANLKKHDGGATWKDMESRLTKAGYSVEAERLSPHRFGIPQIRERFFIVAKREGLSGFRWPVPDKGVKTTIESVLDKHPVNAKDLSAQVIECLNTWQGFLKAMPKNVEFPASPLWTMEFGATYPFEDTTPWTKRQFLATYRGSFGASLKGVAWQEAMNRLPSHARTRRPHFPDWKIRFIQKNREFYRANKKWIDPWLPKIQQFPSSLQKLEWNCRGEKRDIWLYVIQFRASGVRVKRRTTSPSLIAMTTTQVPIIAWESRYMSPSECAKLQSMDKLTLPNTEDAAYAALGNAVNVRVVHLVASALLGDMSSTKTFRAA